MVGLQPELARIAAIANARGHGELLPRYWRYAGWWTLPGYPAFASMLGVYYLMVFKPTPGMT
ncbi:DUF2269 family protein [Paraburkholderia ultramafica]|uniref:DUF2269 family protein n=1 Tax=Paraburkholderia ultramafica TaxID=1544867 RepID=UPI001FEB4998|nr:DUF2269 family protein [Paraburkholderia ultramafica]